MAYVRLVDVTKSFSGVKALAGVSLEINQGEVLALLGENGAGKSTLMNILSGVYPYGTYGGDIYIAGSLVKFSSPADAEQNGVAIIHQELSTFPHLSVGENLWVGHWPRKGGLIDWSAIHSNARFWLDRVGCDLDSSITMGDLSTGSQQLVEIAKALSRKSKILIFDEPTSSLTPTEVQRLFELILRLRAEGTAIVYISHKMEEIFALSDRITILRDGRSIATHLTKDASESELISQMVGRSLDRLFPHRAERSSDFMAMPPALEVKDFTVSQRMGRKRIGPVSFELRRGEIIGLAGLLGSGRTEFLQGLLGASSIYSTSGKVKIGASSYLPRHPRQAVSSRIGYVGEDRKRDSIFAVRSLNENVSISRLSRGTLGKPLRMSAEESLTNQTLSHLRTKYHKSEQAIKELSGGNQQKVVLGRILQISPDIIFLDEPTRGVDVGAKYEIYQILFDLANEGKALIVVSSDLPELMALSDRIMVISDGKFTGELSRPQFSQAEIMRLAVNATAQTTVVSE